MFRIQRHSERLRSPQARQHLIDGFQRRVRLNQVSRLRIAAIANPQRRDVLDVDTCAELNVHLNSFFVQIRGGLDNLAWALHYERRLLGDSDEEDRKLRSRVGLFHPDFQRALRAFEPKLVDWLAKKAQWFESFTALRDPVAHRIPLYAMPGVIKVGSREAELTAALEKDVEDAIADRDLERAHDAFIESTRVGTYEPFVAQYSPKQLVVRNIGLQIERDHAEFLEIGEAVLSVLFTDASDGS